MRDEELYELSDEELEKAFREAKAELGSPDDEFGDTDEFSDENDEADDLGTTDEDSDDDASTDDEETEETDGDSESEDVDPDGDDNEEEEQTAEVDDGPADEVRPVEKFKVKANGREYEFTDAEMRERFPSIFGQAMDYTKKMQAMKPWRKTIDAIESAQLSHEDINLMIDVLKGDKNAIAEVIRKTGVDALELDTEDSKYTPKDYGRDESTLALKDVIDEISSDKEYEITQKVLGKEWDESSWKIVSANPEMIRGLHVDVKTGMYDKYSAIAEKLKLYDGGRKSDLDYYKDAAIQYHAEESAQANAVRERELASAKEAQEAEAKRIAAVEEKNRKIQATKEAAKSRKAAAPTTTGSKKPKVVDYLNIDDEEWEDWYNRTMENKI